MPHVTSPDNPRLKEAMRLIASSRERRKSGRCVLEGEHLVAAFSARHGAPELVIVAAGAASGASLRAIPGGMKPPDVLIVSEKTWAELTQLPPSTGVLAVVTAPQPVFKRSSEFCLLLDDIQDPGNMGSILRSAAAAGVAQVFTSAHCVFAWSPKVLRAAQGAHFQLDIFEDTDLLAWVHAYRGVTAATVASGGVSLFDANLGGPVALVVGNEGAGVSAELLAATKLKVTIPMPGGFESLNAAAAAAIALFECVRQRSAGRALTTRSSRL